MRLVLDEHYAPSIAVKLREIGYDVVTVPEIPGLRESPDQKLLQWAQREQRVVVTENVRDFMRLHHVYLNRGELHAGILLTSPRAFPRQMSAVGRLIAALRAFIDERPETHDLAGKVAWL